MARDGRKRGTRQRERRSVGRRTAELKSAWTEVGGLRVHARLSTQTQPEGTPPIILVHGLGVASRSMVPLAKALAPSYHVLAPDLPGFGDSEKPPHVLNLAELTDCLAAWTRACGLERAVFLGNSVGCQLVVRLAVRHPELVERVVLQGPTMDPGARTMRQQTWLWIRNSRGERGSLTPIALREYWRCGLRCLLKTFRYALEDPIEEKLPGVRVPALVVRGSWDPIVTQRWAEEVADLLPMGRLVVIPDGPHTLVHNRPLDLARVVREFLSAAPAKRRDV
jgi:2-hydroxy-6-oxonona-2,4-dienedioate hydrolase